MLTYRKASVVFLVLAAFIIILIFAFASLRPSVYLLILILIVWYADVLAFGSFKICSGFYLKVFCRKKTTEKIVSLTFDDGPDAVNTQIILDILEKHGVPAAFFVIGRKAELFQEIIVNIDNKSHLIGNHSYSHAFFFDFFGRKKMEQDLLKADEVIRKITGKQQMMFRPPYGVTNPVLARVVKKLGYRVIGWSVRSFDTTIKDENKLIERVINRLHPGAVVLLHDDREITGRVLEDIILRIKEKGYRFVGLKELIGAEAFKN